MTTAILAALALSAPGHGDFVVYPFYVYPSDQPYHREYVDAIRKVVVEVQDWYQKKAGVTFRLAPLQVKRGKDYASMRGAPADKLQELPRWWQSLEETVGGYKPKRVYWIFAQGGGGFAGANLIGDWTGIGVFGDWVLEPISGVREPKAIHSGFATWQVQGGTPKGTTVHELGHAFGLHHPDNYEGKTIMRWHGDYPDTGLLPHEAMILRNSPFFVPNAYDATAPHLDFENADVMKWGETVELRGKGFAAGDKVEFRDTRQSIVVEPELVNGTLKVAVPTNLGPGFIRVLRGKLRSNVVPVNFYEK
jgi:hypothetical protein